MFRTFPGNQMHQQRGRPQYRQYNVVNESRSPSEMASTNRIREVPVKESIRKKLVNDWVISGEYELGSPENWQVYPDEIVLITELFQTPNQSPATNQAHKGPTNAPISSTSQQVVGGQFVQQPHARPNRVMGREASTLMRSQPAVRREPNIRREQNARRVSNVRRVPVDDVIGPNNSNEMDPADYVGENEVINYPPWVLYLYPVLPTPPPNNEATYVEA